MNKSIKMNTPELLIDWADTHEPNDKGWYGVKLSLLPGSNPTHKKFLGALRKHADDNLSIIEGKDKLYYPWWTKKADAATYIINPATKDMTKVKWLDEFGTKTSPPDMLLKGSKVKVEFGITFSKCGHYMNLWLNAITVVEVPESQAPATPEHPPMDDFDESDVPF